MMFHLIRLKSMSTHILHRTSKLSPMVGYETYKEGGVNSDHKPGKERETTLCHSKPAIVSLHTAAASSNHHKPVPVNSGGTTST